MSNAYVFETPIEGESYEFLAVAHTLGAVVLYDQNDRRKEFLLLTADDLRELLKLAESCE